MVEARLRLLNSSLRTTNAGSSRGGGTPDWFQFLSESCAPVTTCGDAHAFLARHRAASFVPSLNISQWVTSGVGTKNVAEHLRVRLRDHSFSPENYRTGAGGGWVTLNHEAARLVMEVQMRYRQEFAVRNNTGRKRWQIAQECPDEVPTNPFPQPLPTTTHPYLGVQLASPRPCACLTAQC